ncbi:MAG: hypothetical protein IKI93_05715, partial [Clostridia bacterium]|nr:hypothetical protein [Clostridia bacterium]
MDSDKKRDGALYIYNRVCTKEEKQNEIKRAYGRDQHKSHRNSAGSSGSVRRNQASQNGYSGPASNGSRPFGMEFAQAQMRRAEAAGYGS